ncbi:MAG: amino acid ABC transporter permease [Gracilibacteraceae bacterium]|jgi:L-cystine transport system permease protein|nr:amino acid ABC transporter permease [Gracilibacteraceae bacterium]
MEHFVSVFPYIFSALPLTLFMMLASLLAGAALGLLFALIRIRRLPVLRQGATVLISFIRGTPPLVQLFLVFYGLPKIVELFGLNINNWDKVVFSIITFSFIGGAYYSEMFRSAYQAVPTAQTEAALSVGLTGWSSFYHIILPQTFAILLPLLGNSVTNVLKETSLAFTIGVSDIMGKAQLEIGRTYGVAALQTYLEVSLIYWLICLAVGKGVILLEEIFKKGHTGLA